MVGVQLASSGYPVSFLVRPQIAERLKLQGLTLWNNNDSLLLRKPSLTTNLAHTLSTQTIDVIVLAVKSYDTSNFIAELAAVDADVPPILCLQNGVDNEGLLTKTFGADRVLAGTVTTAVSLIRSGEVRVERARGVGIAKGHTISKIVAQALTVSGFTTHLYRDAQSMKWTKLLTNLIANATCAICDLPPRKIFEHDALYQLEIDSLRETLNVMKSLGVPLSGLPRTPTRTLGFACKYLPTSLYRSLMTKKVDTGRGNKMPSLHRDLASGKLRTEVSFLNGAVALHGSHLSINTPVNHGLTQILTSITEDRLEWDTYKGQPERLADALLS